MKSPEPACPNDRQLAPHELWERIKAGMCALWCVRCRKFVGSVPCAPARTMNAKIRP